MGNYKFRLSDMIPNVWFYKLKDMANSNRTRNHSSNSNNRKKQNPVSPPSKTKQPHHFYPRKSYYFTRELIPADNRFYTSPTKTKSIDPHIFPDPPRKSSKQQRSKKLNTKLVVASSLSPSSDDSSLKHEFRADCILTTESFDNMVSWSHNKLPPIITKAAKEPTKYRASSVSVKVVKQDKKNIRVNSPGVRLRVNSPRIASRRIQAAHGRKSVSSSSSSSLSGSCAVVKSSCDPQRDFRESMVEMIMENNIRASKDLEDLLACYLSLNSDEYHDVIIKVFKQIWFDLSNVRMK
ncbi:hypothetical protein E1A91_A09G230600v1 [Gossypium mustelinum]|uniref:Transcription repressor n=1 Tax=Gossypium mustelinum TaxID=34275 RepID=A0A5D2Y0X8_GOSMU|nr:hypothetical protein E1A91_A09G230600v1 [Gossypium mustelinum]